MVGKLLNRCISCGLLVLKTIHFIPTELPNSKVIIGNTERKTIVRETFNISDAYNQYGGNNSLNQ